MPAKFSITPTTEDTAAVNEKKVTTAKILKTKSSKKFPIKTGNTILSNPRAVNIMLMGELNSGKSHTVIDILLMGYKVYYLGTDFGKAGDEAISNYFATHPDDAHFYRQNFRALVPMKEDSYDAVQAFTRDPESVDPEIYDFDPDFLFWDGLSSYQQNDVEAKFAHDEGDYLMEDSDWGTWRSTRNATLFPLNDFLELHNVKTGKPWHHIVTTLEKKAGDKKLVNVGSKKEWETVAGTEKFKPLLHTSAEKISLAGFSIAIRTVRKYMENEDKTTFSYENRSRDLQLKDRGYGLPAKVEPANFRTLWENYIIPCIRPVPETKTVGDENL